MVVARALSQSISWVSQSISSLMPFLQASSRFSASTTICWYMGRDIDARLRTWASELLPLHASNAHLSQSLETAALHSRGRFKYFEYMGMNSQNTRENVRS